MYKVSTALSMVVGCRHLCMSSSPVAMGACRHGEGRETMGVPTYFLAPLVDTHAAGYAWSREGICRLGEAMPCYADTCASRTPCRLRSHASGPRRISPRRERRVRNRCSCLCVPISYHPPGPWSRHAQQSNTTHSTHARTPAMDEKRNKGDVPYLTLSVLPPFLVRTIFIREHRAMSMQ